EFANEIRFGNSRSHTSVRQANRVGNEQRRRFVYGESNTWLQEIAYGNENLQSCSGGIFTFNEINLEQYLAEVGFAFDAGPADHLCVGTLRAPEAKFFPGGVGKVGKFLLSPRGNRGIGKIGCRRYVAKRDDFLTTCG